MDNMIGIKCANNNIRKSIPTNVAQIRDQQHYIFKIYQHQPPTKLHSPTPTSTYIQNIIPPNNIIAILY